MILNHSRRFLYRMFFLFRLHPVSARWAPWWKEIDHDVRRFGVPRGVLWLFYLVHFSCAKCRVEYLSLSPSCDVCRKGCDWGVRHAPWPQGHQEVWHWWGHCCAQGHLEEVNMADDGRCGLQWLPPLQWGPRSAFLATGRPVRRLRKRRFWVRCSWSSDPFREPRKKGKICERYEGTVDYSLQLQIPQPDSRMLQFRYF